MLTALFMGLVLPGVLLNFAVMLLSAPPQAPLPAQTAPPPATAPRVALSMRFRNADADVREMDMDTYLTGVVLAEMPVSFETEALKAQAIVARTYARRAYETGGKHGDGSVCGESTCCQAYLSENDYLSKGGTLEGVSKVRAAVEATSGYVLTYEGSLIEATYFSCSGGSTEDAVAVWGTDYPYLRAVPSPGEENAVHDTDTVTFTPEQFQAALGCNLSGDPETWFGAVTYTNGAGVSTMVIGGVTYTGPKLRAMLGLRSTAFSIATGADGITITTRGFGHRVGMSQYGADAMAVTGSTCAEILAHYYQGTTLTCLPSE